MFLVSALYPNASGSRFDGRHYTGPHASLARQLLAPELTGLRVTLGEATLDGAPPPFHAISEMRFTDEAGFRTAMARAGEALFADAANYTDVEPVLQVGTVAIDDQIA